MLIVTISKRLWHSGTRNKEVPPMRSDYLIIKEEQYEF